MATAVVISGGAYVAKGIHSISWQFITGLTGFSNDLNAPMLPDKTIQVKGLVGGANTSRVAIEGSNDENANGTYVTLTDDQGEELLFADVVSGISLIAQNPKFIRARVSEITSGVTIDVTIISTGPLR